MKRRELLEAAAYIHEQLVRGKKDSYIRRQLGLEVEEYEEAKKFLLESKAEEYRETPREHVYAQYVIEQKRNIKDLDALVKNLNYSSQYNAVIGAIRLRSDIQERIVTRGQEFGMIKKEPERRVMIGGVALFDMATDDLRKQIVSQTKMLAGVMGDYGERDFSSVSIKPLHYGESAFTETTGESVDEDDERELTKPTPEARRKAAAAAIKKVFRSPAKTAR